MIAMVNLRISLLVISLCLLVSCTVSFMPGMVYENNVSLQQHKIYPTSAVSPSIYHWGIVGRVNESEPFTVWANVTDDDGDLANVTVHVIGPNTTIHELMPFNGSLYVKGLDPLVESGDYDITVTATDLTNRTRTSWHMYITVPSTTTGPPDPSITMPYVVIPSLLVGLLAIIIAFYHARRR